MRVRASRYFILAERVHQLSDSIDLCRRSDIYYLCWYFKHMGYRTCHRLILPLKHVRLEVRKLIARSCRDRVFPNCVPEVKFWSWIMTANNPYLCLRYLKMVCKFALSLPILASKDWLFSPLNGYLDCRQTEEIVVMRSLCWHFFSYNSFVIKDKDTCE